MERYIKTYPKIFSKQECDGIIEYFNIQKINKNITHTELKDHRHFDEINLNDFRDETLDTQMGIYDRFKYVLQQYKEETGLHEHAWPENFKGGETEFPDLDLTISPECGTMLLFPSTWTYLHRGNTPISNDKYILGSYLHYV